MNAEPTMNAQENCQEIWDALSREPGIGITIISLEGVITFANDEATRLYLGEPRDVVGLKLEEVIPAELVEQTLERGKRCLAENRSFSSRILWRAREVMNSYHPLHDNEDGESEPDRFLVISRLSSSGGEVVETDLTSEFVDLGELAVLTPRELEVLSLIGQGLRIADIAQILHRSERTIEKHRESIGRKLNQTDRVQLALIASRAGLRVEDAKLKRVTSSERPKSADE